MKAPGAGQGLLYPDSIPFIQHSQILSRATRLTHLGNALRIQQGAASDELKMTFLRTLTLKACPAKYDKLVQAAALLVIAEAEKWGPDALHTAVFIARGGVLPAEELGRRVALISQYPGIEIWFYAEI